MSRRAAASESVLAVGLLASLPAFGQSVPDDGGMHQWVTVGAPGNAPYTGTPGNLPAFGPQRELLLNSGSVDYSYRMSRTELTHGQYLQFINAFNSTPTIIAQRNAYFSSVNVPLDISGTSPDGFELLAERPDGTLEFGLRNPGWSNVAVQVTWRVAALYCNWLTNGRQNTFESFMTGSYNAYSWSTLTDGTYTDDRNRMDGALFFIPNLNESIKAAHFDPNRYGPNQGGYWLYGNSRDSTPVYGQPGATVNGQPVNATYPGWFANPITVGSIPTVTSPWGLLDSVGGYSEWVENSLITTGPNNLRVSRSDRLDGLGQSSVYVQVGTTLRIASVIPAPGPSTLVLLGLAVAARRSRSSPGCHQPALSRG